MVVKVRWDELHIGDRVLACEDTDWGDSSIGGRVVHGVRDYTPTRFELFAQWGQYGLSWAEYDKGYVFTIERPDWPDTLGANLRDAGYAQLAFDRGYECGVEVEQYPATPWHKLLWTPGCRRPVREGG